MTVGEKMVYAAAFALEFQRVRRDSPTTHEHAQKAAVFAHAAVIALRFGAPESEFRTAMVEHSDE